MKKKANKAKYKLGPGLAFRKALSEKDREVIKVLGKDRIIEFQTDVNEHLTDEEHEKLYPLYMSEMPYGTAKARDGDPFDWIEKTVCEIPVSAPGELRCYDCGCSEFEAYFVARNVIQLDARGVWQLKDVGFTSFDRVTKLKCVQCGKRFEKENWNYFVHQSLITTKQWEKKDIENRIKKKAW